MKVKHCLNIFVSPQVEETKSDVAIDRCKF